MGWCCAPLYIPRILIYIPVHQALHVLSFDRTFYRTFYRNFHPQFPHPNFEELGRCFRNYIKEGFGVKTHWGRKLDKRYMTFRRKLRSFYKMVIVTIKYLARAKYRYYCRKAAHTTRYHVTATPWYSGSHFVSLNLIYIILLNSISGCQCRLLVLH